MQPPCSALKPSSKRQLFSDLTNSSQLPKTTPSKITHPETNIENQRSDQIPSISQYLQNNVSQPQKFSQLCLPKSDMQHIDDQFSKLNGLFQLFEAILLKNILTKSIQYDYQKFYDHVYQLVTSQKTHQIQPFEDKCKFNNYRDLILHYLFNTVIKKKTVPKICHNLQSSLKNNNLSANNNQCTKILNALLENIDELCALLLYIQTDINSNCSIDTSSSQSIPSNQDPAQVSSLSDDTSQMRFRWNDSPDFSIKANINSIFARELLGIDPKNCQISNLQCSPKQNIFVRSIQNGILYMFEHSMSQIQSLNVAVSIEKSIRIEIYLLKENKTNVKSSLLSLASKIFQLLSKCWHSLQQKVNDQHTLHLVQKIILNDFFRKSLLEISRSTFNDLIENIQNSSKIGAIQQKNVSLEQKCQKIIKFVQSGKKSLMMLKKLLRQLFLEPPFNFYTQKKQTTKKSNQEYLNERMLIKQNINEVIIEIFVSSIFTSQNLNFIVKTLSHSLHLFYKSFNQTDYNETFIFSKSLFSIFLGEPHQQDVFYSLQFLQNYPIASKIHKIQLEYGKSHLLIFHQYIERSKTFFNLYNDLIFCKIDDYFRLRFRDKIKLSDQKTIRKSNQLILSFLCHYQQIQKLICSKPEPKNCLDILIKENTTKFSHLINQFITIIELPQSNFQLRLIAFLHPLTEYFQYSQKERISAQQRRESQRKIFMSLFKLGCKYSGFLANFQKLICAVMTQNVLHEIPKLQDIQFYEDKVKFRIIDDELLKQIKFLEGTEYVTRISELVDAIKSVNAGYFYRDLFASTQTKNIKLQSSNKGTASKVVQVKKQQKLSYPQQLSLKTLSKMNVILISQNSFSHLRKSTFLSKLSPTFSLIYRSPSSQSKVEPQLGLKPITTFALDPILSKFATQYEEKYKQIGKESAVRCQQKSLTWVINSCFQANVILDIKIPKSLKAQNMNNSSVNIGSVRKENLTPNHSHVISNQKEVDHDKYKKLTVRMPLLMADFFLFAFRKVLETKQQSSFSIIDFLKSRSLFQKDPATNQDYYHLIQFLKKQVIIMIQCGFFNFSHQTEIKNLTKIDQAASLVLSQSLLQWQTQNQHEFLGKCWAKCSQRNQNYKMNIRKPFFIDFLHIKNTNLAFTEKQQLGETENSLNNLSACIIENPSQQVSLMIECLVIRFFKRQKKVKCSETIKKCLVFITDHLQKNKSCPNSSMKSLRQCLNRILNEDSCELQAKMDNLIKKIIQKLINKDYINIITNEGSINWQSCTDTLLEYNP